MLSLVLPVLAALTVASAISPYDVPPAEWNALNTTVGGRLARGVPLARACFAQAGVNVTAATIDCPSVQAKYGLDTFRVTQFGASLRTQWETCQKTNQGCLLDSDRPTNVTAFSPPRVCNQGSVAPYYITVATPADVIQAFSFSKRTSVPLSIKNTGHDYAGKSVVPGTLALWTHNIKYINYTTTFVPAQCDTQGVPALTYGAGQDMESLYLFAEANNITFIGGSGKTVGAAGGWVLGGGHSVLSNTYGLGVDRALQFRVVTPTGHSLIANACQNQDLFWALRGGGGGTFGVVLEVTSQVVPNKVQTVSLIWQLEPTAANVLGFMKVVIANSLQWSREGWGGYIYTGTSILANPKLNATAAAASLKPLTDFLTSASAKSQWSTYDSYLPLFSAINSQPIPAGINGALTSRLIPSTLFEPANQAALLNATIQTINAAAAAGGRASFYMTTPFSYQTQPGWAGATSATPAWRGAIWHAITSTQWDWDAGVDVGKQAYTGIYRAIQPFRALTPGGGAYLNEADVYEPDPFGAFWGSNYQRLNATKHKYDPDGLLDCYHCVGWKGKATPIASCYY